MVSCQRARVRRPYFLARRVSIFSRRSPSAFWISLNIRSCSCSGSSWKISTSTFTRLEVITIASISCSPPRSQSTEVSSSLATLGNLSFSTNPSTNQCCTACGDSSIRLARSAFVYLRPAAASRLTFRSKAILMRSATSSFVGSFCILEGLRSYVVGGSLFRLT